MADVRDETKFREQLAKLTWAAKPDSSSKRPKSAGYTGGKKVIRRPAQAAPCTATVYASSPALPQGCSFDSELLPPEVEQRSATRPSTATCRRLNYSELSAPCAPPAAPSQRLNYSELAAPCAPPAAPSQPPAPSPGDDLENLPRLLRASGTRPEWLQSFQKELMDAFREEFRAVNKAVAEIRHEVKASVSQTSSNLATGFAQVSTSLSHTLTQTQQRRPEAEHPRLVQEAPASKSDVSTLLAGFQREMDRPPSGSRASLASATPAAAREERGEEKLAVGEDKLAKILQEVEKLKAQMDLTPVLEAVREQRPQTDVSRIIEHIRKGRAEVDLSGVLEEVRRVRKEVDFSPVLAAIQSGGARPDQDIAALREEVRGMRQELASRASDMGKVDTPAVLQELRRLSGGLSLLRKPAFPESAHGGHKLHAVIQRVIADAKAKARERESAEAAMCSEEGKQGQPTRQENGKPAQPGCSSEAGSEEDASAVGRSATEATEAPEGLLQVENETLRSDIFALRWELQRLEALMDKKMEDYNKFVEGLTQSSAQPTLSEAYDLSRADILGKGHYGYVLRCAQRDTGEQVVAKVLSERWARVVVGEWAHGAESWEHPNIVRHMAVLMHRDKEGEMRRRIKAAFDAGSLPGKCPARFPESYFCLILEFMDQGSAQQLVDRGHLTLEGLAAIVRQVASALAFMHKRKRTHNDVKPENILLKRSPSDGCLLVKLADLGLAEHSTDRTRDHDLLAYSIWCMALGRSFGQCPSGQRRDAAVDELRGLAAEQRNGGLAKGLAKLVQGLWRASTGMAEVEAASELKGHEVHIHMSRQNSHSGSDVELPLKPAKSIR